MGRTSPGTSTDHLFATDNRGKPVKNIRVTIRHTTIETTTASAVNLNNGFIRLTVQRVRITTTDLLVEEV